MTGLNDGRRDEGKILAGRQRGQGCVKAVLTAAPSLAGGRLFPVGAADDERLFGVDDVLDDAPGDPPQRGLGQRPLALEYARAGQAPVDALRRRPPGFQTSNFTNSPCNFRIWGLISAGVT